MTPKELREKTVQERTNLLKQLREELFHLRLKRSTAQLEKVHRIREIKKDIARLLTLESLQKKGK